MRTILHIDMNSYFASVAEQMNPFLRGKSIGVGGKPGTRGIIAAASREAKLRGVKTAMSAYEALRACPELEIIDGDIDATLDCTRRFLKIFRRYTDAVEVFSIDEAFLDLGNHCDPERSEGEAISIAQKIKRDLRAELGEYLTCSVGIAPNKLLAKLASGMKKPDGLSIIDKEIASVAALPRDGNKKSNHCERPPASLREALRAGSEAISYAFEELTERLPCTALCGIGPRVGLRLQSLGIKTIKDLGDAPIGRLVDEFGPVLGYSLHQMGLGEDNSPVISAEPDPKSFGNSYTLLHDSTDRDELRKILYALTVKMTSRMRSEGFSARTVSGLIRYHNFSHESIQARLAAPSNDPLMVFRAIWQTIKAHLGLIPVRLLGVYATDLVQGGEQLELSLLSSRAQPRDLITHATDAINSRYGPRTIEPALIMTTELKRHVSGFKNGQQLDK